MGPDAENQVPLSNKQQFMPVPYAMWSTAATDFVINSTALIEGTTAVTASDQDGPLIIRDPESGQMALDGDELDSNRTLLLNWRSEEPVMTGGPLSARGDIKLGKLDGTHIHRVATYGDGDQMDFNPDGAGAKSRFGHHVQVNSTLTATGLVTAGNVSTTNLTTSGAVNLNYNPSGNALVVKGKANFQNTVSGLTGTIVWSDCETIDLNSAGDSQSDRDCPDNKWLRGARVQDHNNVGGDGTLIHEFRCCAASITIQ